MYCEANSTLSRHSLTLPRLARKKEEKGKITSNMLYAISRVKREQKRGEKKIFKCKEFFLWLIVSYKGRFFMYLIDLKIYHSLPLRDEALFIPLFLLHTPFPSLRSTTHKKSYSFFFPFGFLFFALF